jgi:hypothetical protein
VNEAPGSFKLITRKGVQDLNKNSLTGITVYSLKIIKIEFSSKKITLECVCL